MPSTKQRIISHIAQIAFPEPVTAPNQQTVGPGGPSHLSPYPPPANDPYASPGNSYGGYPQPNAPTPYSSAGAYSHHNTPNPHSSPYGGYPHQSAPSPYYSTGNANGGYPQQNRHSPYPPAGNPYGYPQHSAHNSRVSAGNAPGGYPQQNISNPYVSGGNTYGGYPQQGASNPHVSSTYQDRPPQTGNGPISFLFYIPKVQNKSGQVTDEGGNTVYVLTAEADKHSFMGGLVDMPLYITRNDGTKVANIHWKTEHLDTKIEPFTVWGDYKGRITWGKRNGECVKTKFMGEIADKKGVFAIPTPSGPLDFSWESEDKGKTYLLLDRQRMTSVGSGLGSKDGYNAVARYTCHSKTKKDSSQPNAKIEIMPEAMNRVPGILDACIISCFFCEMMKLARIAEIAGAVGAVGEAAGAVAAVV